jgi:hypothetical protein
MAEESLFDFWHTKIAGFLLLFFIPSSFLFNTSLFISFRYFYSQKTTGLLNKTNILLKNRGERVKNHRVYGHTVAKKHQSEFTFPIPSHVGTQANI